MKIIGSKGSKQYTLKDILGTGSFGKVYYSPPYAIKQMTMNVQPYLKTALNNQIKILLSLKHPNIVALYDVLYENNYVYLIMEYCQYDLCKYIKKFKIDEKAAIHIFRQIVAGFSKLVQKGIIHRDLKPANILVTAKKEFKLADFGFAKHVDQYDSKLMYSIVGTPLYMAPQILKRNKYTTKCDIWSIGFIFYEVLTGRVPWTGNSQNDLYNNIIKKPLSFPSQISQWSRQILKKMLVVNEQDRISWQDLIKYVLKSSMEKGKKNNLVENQKVQKKIKSQNKLPIDQIPKQYNTFSVEQLTGLLELELMAYFNQDKSHQIATDRRCILSLEDKEKVRNVLQLFTEAYQNYIKTNLIISL